MDTERLRDAFHGHIIAEPLQGCDGPLAVTFLLFGSLVRIALPLIILKDPKRGNVHIPSLLVVERVTVHRKPPEVRICRLSIQSGVGTRPPSTKNPAGCPTASCGEESGQ